MLEVLVGEDGAVKDVTVRDGAEPFATAATIAARKYLFTPAKRGDRVVAARIRMVVEFTPEHDAPARAPTGDTAATDAPPATIEKPQPRSPPERIEEVRIEGVRTPPQESATEHKMARADIRLVPGAFGDPFRAIDALPGVVPTISGLPYYYIRGAPPSAVGYFIDDVRVPYLFHFALGPGVIQPALVDQVAMHPAAFPGRFGRYAGAIITGTTRAPPSELYGEGNIRIFDAGAYVEVPFADGRATAGIGGRYSYTGALFSIVAKDTTIDYRDYNARATYQLTKDWRATLFAFGSYDYASQMEKQPDGTKVENVLFASEFHRVDLHFDRAGDNGSESRLGVTFGVDRTRLGAARFAQDFVFGVRGRHLAKVSKDFDVEVGIDTTIDHYTGDLPSPYAVSDSDYTSAVAFFAPRTDTATGAWVSGLWHWGGVELTATMRGDVFTSVGNVAVGPSPRVSMKVPLDHRTRFLGAIGVGAQPPLFSIPIPAVGYRGLPGGVGYGWQKSLGFERDLPLHFTARAMGFHHSYFNLRDFGRNAEDLSFDKPQDVPSSPTQAYGLELYLHRNLSERVGMFMSYTLSRAVLGSEESTAKKVAVPERISPFDRTHVFQIGGAVYVGAGWTFSSRFLTYRGWPDEGNNVVSGVPSGRLDPFWRIDGRIEKRWKWRKAGYISLVLEALNASAQKEIVSRSCASSALTAGAAVCKNNEIGPVTAPSIGVEGAL